MPAVSEVEAIIDIAQRLADRFRGADPVTVAALVRAKHHEFDGSPIRDFVPVMVERAARADLAHSA